MSNEKLKDYSNKLNTPEGKLDKNFIPLQIQTYKILDGFRYIFSPFQILDIFLFFEHPSH